MNKRRVLIRWRTRGWFDVDCQLKKRNKWRCEERFPLGHAGKQESGQTFTRNLSRGATGVPQWGGTGHVERAPAGRGSKQPLAKNCSSGGSKGLADQEARRPSKETKF